MQFDEIYANAMPGQAISKLVGKNLLVRFKRKMVWDQKYREDSEVEPFMPVTWPIENPRKDDYFLQALFGIYKFLRMYFVCFGFYFVPFITLGLEYYRANIKTDVKTTIKK